jgi:hypothetical protein
VFLSTRRRTIFKQVSKIILTMGFVIINHPWKHTCGWYVLFSTLLSTNPSHRKNNQPSLGKGICADDDDDATISTFGMTDAK